METRDYNPATMTTLDYATPPVPSAKVEGAVPSRLALLLCLPFCTGEFLDLRSWTGDIPRALLCAVFLPATAVVLALLARRASKANPNAAVSARARLALAIGVCELAISGVFVLSHARWPQASIPPATHRRCLSNLRQIGLALHAYAARSRGHFPPTLDLLIANGALGPEVFICPGSSDVPATGATTSQVVQSFVAGPAHCSYVYHCPPTPIGKPQAKFILAHESPANHANAGGMNALYLDGSVEFVDATRARQILAELQAGHNPPRNESP